MKLDYAYGIVTRIQDKGFSPHQIQVHGVGGSGKRASSYMALTLTLSCTAPPAS